MNEMTHRPSIDSPQLRTLLLTDLCDSTALVESIGDVATATLFRDHDRLVLDLQQRWRGRLIDRSDGLLLMFERPIDGLGFALDYVRTLEVMSASLGKEIKARAGLHVGEVLTWRNTDEAVLAGAKPLEVEGLAKPTAARLMSMARPGQILLSSVAEPLAHRASRELGERGQQLLWKSHGRWRFKGMPESQHVYEVGEPGIAPLRAPPNTPKAWRDIPLWRRPASLVAEAAVVAMFGIGIWFMTRPAPAIAFNQRDWVVVADLRNLTGQTVLDDSLQQAFRISLEQSRYVNVLSDMKTRNTLERMRLQPGTPLDRAIASEIAMRDGARAVILPTVAEVGGKLRVSVEVIDPHTQATVYAESVDGNGAESALSSIDEATRTLRGKLGEAIASIDKDSVKLPEATTGDLDALRAYALGQKAYGRGQYADAKGFYTNAVKLDGSFALAYIGLLRAHNALDDLPGGVANLRKAAKLRDHLPPRDAMYLDAWLAQVDAPLQALDRWRELSAMYPDFFPAAANVGYDLFSRNRFAEGLVFAKRASAAQYEFSPLATDLVGQFQLALENYDEAKAAFAHATGDGVGKAILRGASANAAEGQFDAAEALFAKAAADVKSDDFNHAAVYLDRGQWRQARREAESVIKAVESGSFRARAATFPIAVSEWVQGSRDASLRRLRDTARSALKAVDSPGNAAGALDDAYLAASAGILAQRMGDVELGREVARRLQPQKALLGAPSLRDMMVVLVANDLRSSGKPAEALSNLENAIDGDERFQVRVALLEAYAQAGKTEQALAQAQWLSTHRGRAYIELGCGWCQQSLNVVDTNLSQLRAAELQMQLGRKEDATKDLAVFDRRWNPATLPDYLRVRRDALLAASN
ncbi:putative peptide modification system cyclase [Lysobacter sp. S4-A87]|uniref:putative peptide modification system cyclase n=1 Tax=Lysobacter sp. S4-A87 TaxID=2925843 RepID=UPI001F52C515|nr:putative peptide modification system cyclase [Lysobacter sp. S4-A87]UNK48118.1 putative peptide modification system cyclase [Lysobacter sp. S4-A87]